MLRRNAGNKKRKINGSAGLSIWRKPKERKIGTRVEPYHLRSSSHNTTYSFCFGFSFLPCVSVELVRLFVQQSRQVPRLVGREDDVSDAILVGLQVGMVYDNLTPFVQSNF